MNFNKVFIGGRLARDPSLRYLPSQVAICEFSIACNRKYTTKTGEEREEVLFVDAKAWGKTGEIINKHFRKGKEIFVEASLKQEVWEAKDGGGKRSKIVLNVESFQFVGYDGDKQQRTTNENAQDGPAEQANQTPTVTEEDIPW